MDVAPRSTREDNIRTGVKRKLVQNGFRSAVQEASRFTDTKYVDNLKHNTVKKKNPFGHSFAAVRILKESFDKEYPFLVYDYSDGEDKGFPYIVLSSQKKTELMANMDRDGTHHMRETVSHLDVIHGWAKSFKTYTLSYYDVPLKRMVKFCTMITVAESKETCEFFFTSVNSLIAEYSEVDSVSFPQIFA